MGPILAVSRRGRGDNHSKKRLSMMTIRVKKITVSIAIMVLVGVVAVFAFMIRQGLREFSVEDTIHGEFFPVVRALHAYQADHGAPAAVLTDLVPNYLPALPRFDRVDAIGYKVTKDGKQWEFSLHSTALSHARFYVSRSDQHYTPEEEKRVLLRYHGYWTVLRE